MSQILRIASLVLCIILAVVPTTKGQVIQLGTVTDAATGLPIGGASIRIQGTTKGTYTRSNGTFRLPLLNTEHTLLIRSIGYKEATIATAPLQHLAINLESTGITKPSVEVVANIEPSEVIKRAIAKASENDRRLQTLISTTYSKMRVYVDAPMLTGVSVPKESITETFAKVYYQRYPQRQKRVHILQRRQTRNIPASSNLAVFDDFVNITQPEMQFLDTRMVMPLGADALDTYTYRIVSRKPLGDRIVYEVAFEPTSRLFPGFEGTLSIVDGSYQVVAADFGPTPQTAIPSVKGLRYVQRYEQATDSLWVPMYQLVTGEGAVSVVAGLAEFVLKLSIEAYVTQVEPNAAIADSLLHPKRDTAVETSTTTKSGGITISVKGNDKQVSVADDADSSRPDFWHAHAYTEMSAEEAKAYRIADSLVANSPPQPTDVKPSIGLITVGSLGVNILPVLTRSTTTGLAGGGELEFVYKPVSLTTMAAWGKNGTTIGKIGVDVAIVKSDGIELSVQGAMFSQVSTIQPQRMILGKENFLNLADLLFMDYADYYRRDGWSVGLTTTTSLIKSKLEFASTRQYAEPLAVDVNRTVVMPTPGNYQTLALTTNINTPSQLGLLFGTKPLVSGTVNATVGREVTGNDMFATLGASLNVNVPTFSTGYRPMELSVTLTGAAVLTATAPRQYQSSLLRRLRALGTTTELATVPNNRYGGNSSVTLHIEHNFSDLWWRAIGLPTISNKRGLDLVAQFGSGITNGSAPIDAQTWTHTTAPYMEAGFALARIPSFVSDLVNLRFDALWPVGSMRSTGSFGWTVTVQGMLF